MYTSPIPALAVVDGSLQMVQLTGEYHTGKNLYYSAQLYATPIEQVRDTWDIKVPTSPELSNALLGDWQVLVKLPRTISMSEVITPAMTFYKITCCECGVVKYYSELSHILHLHQLSCVCGSTILEDIQESTSNLGGMYGSQHQR